MPFYLFQVSYTADAIKAMIAKPSDRKAAATKMVEASGGTLHHLFFSFGPHDVVALIEAPDDKSMVAAAMVIGGSGVASNVMTTKLITAEEAMEAMGMAAKTAASYTPPQG